MTDPYDHLDEDIEAEATKILTEQPVTPRETETTEILTEPPVAYPGRSYGGRPSLAPSFEHLSVMQRNIIRKAVRTGGDVEIGRQARKYGVKRDTVLRVLGRES